MLRSFLKKWLPHRDTIKKEISHPWLKSLLHDPNLWHLNKRSVAGGVAAGLLVAFIPLPLQMLLAILVALAWRVNVLIAIVATWITNPITFFPINFLIYKIGSLILDNKSYAIQEVQEFQFDWSNINNTWHALYSWIASLGKAYLVGLPIVSIGAAIIGYILVRLCWRIAIIIRFYPRQLRKKV